MTWINKDGIKCLTVEEYEEKVISKIGNIKCSKCKNWEKEWHEINDKIVCLNCLKNKSLKTFHFIGGIAQCKD